MVVTYVRNVGRISVDLYDFLRHIDGTGFRQKANTIDLKSPFSDFGGATTIQQALDYISTHMSGGGASVGGGGNQSWSGFIPSNTPAATNIGYANSGYNTPDVDLSAPSPEYVVISSQHLTQFSVNLLDGPVVGASTIINIRVYKKTGGLGSPILIFEASYSEADGGGIKTIEGNVSLVTGDTFYLQVNIAGGTLTSNHRFTATMGDSSVESGGSGGGGVVNLSDLSATIGVLPIVRGGTGLNTVGLSNTVITSNGTVALWNKIVNANVATGAAIAVNKLASGGDDTVLLMQSSAPTWTTITNANIDTNATIVVTKLQHGTPGQVLMTNGSSVNVWTTPSLTPAGGSDKQLQYNNSGVFNGTSNVIYDNGGMVIADSGFISYPSTSPSGTAPTSGLIRLTSNSGSATRTILSVDGGLGALDRPLVSFRDGGGDGYAGLHIGDGVTVDNVQSYNTIVEGFSTIVKNGGQEIFRSNTGAVSFAKPVGGSTFVSKPFSWAVASLSPVGGTVSSPTSAYSPEWSVSGSGSNTTYVLPNVNGTHYYIRNNSGLILTFKVSGQTGTTVDSFTAKWIYCNGTDYKWEGVVV